MPTPGARSAVRFKHEDRPLLDTTIDQRYFVEEQLDELPPGVLYQARQLVLRLPVAMLVVHRRFSEDNRLVKDFKAEVAEAARVTSPHAMPVTDLGRVPDRRLYFTRAILPGETLDMRLTGAGQLSEAEAVTLLEQLEDVLSEMHALELVHGSIRPERVLLFPRRGCDFVKLLDVGCSSLVDASEALSPYCAPEQVEGGGDARSDVYSLALIAHEMVGGRCPVKVPGGAPSPRSPRALGELTEAFVDTVAAALDPDPSRRPSSVRQLVDGLGRAVRSASPRRQVVVLPTSAPGEGWGRAAEEEDRDSGRVPAKAFAEMLRAGVVMPKPVTRPHRIAPGEAMTLQNTLPDSGSLSGGWVPVPSAGMSSAGMSGAGMSKAGRIGARAADAEMSPVRSVMPAVVSGVVETASPTEEPTVEPPEAEAVAVESSRARSATGKGLAVVDTGRVPVVNDLEPAGGRGGRALLRLALALTSIALIAGAIWIIKGEMPSSNNDPRRVVTVDAALAGMSPAGDAPAGIHRSVSLDAAVAVVDAVPRVAQTTTAAVGTPAARRRGRRPRVWRPRPAPRPDASVAVTAGKPGMTDAGAVLRETARVILDAARKAYVAGLYDQAAATAQKLLRLRRNDREALQIVGASACHLSNLRLARDAYRRLGARRRGLLVSICQRKGLPLGGAPAPASAPSAPTGAPAKKSSSEGGAPVAAPAGGTETKRR